MSAKKIRFQSWPVGKLKPARDNPREHSAQQVRQIAASIREFGFLAPIVVDARGEVLAGHGRLMAAKRLRLKEVPVAVDSALTAEQCAAYRIADNVLAGQSTWNKSKLRAAIDRLKVSGFDFASIELPYMDGQLNDDMERERLYEISRKSGAKAPSADDDSEPAAPLDKSQFEQVFLPTSLPSKQAQIVLAAMEAAMRRVSGKLKSYAAITLICREWLAAQRKRG